MADSRAGAGRAILKPQPLSGFPEWLPEEKLVENRFLAVIREEFERFGFAPIETAAVERKEVLGTKGVAEKEIYALARLAAGEGEDAATEMALHFDLTVPMARYVAQNFARLTFPFRRYQMQKVWRGERPQAGRFREFYQCDIDIVGNGTLSPLNDAEIPCVIHAIFSRLAIGRFVIRINNRKILQGLLRHFGLAEGRGTAALRAVDALEKVGPERVAADLQHEAGLEGARARELIALLGGTGSLEQLREGAAVADPLFVEGLSELGQVVEGMRALGMPEEAFRIDLTIARGLDYYTGTVYETQLVANPEIGSICSGGRYDDLASHFINRALPGVGISIGLTRLLSRLFDAGIIKGGAATPAPILVTVMDEGSRPHALALAGELRRAGIGVEVYLEGRRLGDQLKYADKKGFALALIAGPDEIAAGEVQLKDLRGGSQRRLPRATAAATLAGELGPDSRPPVTEVQP